jgi:hypothetical protein
MFILIFGIGATIIVISAQNQAVQYTEQLRFKITPNGTQNVMAAIYIHQNDTFLEMLLYNKSNEWVGSVLKYNLGEVCQISIAFFYLNTTFSTIDYKIGSGPKETSIDVAIIQVVSH